MSCLYWETSFHLPSFSESDGRCNYWSRDWWDLVSSKGKTSSSRQKTVTFLSGKLRYLIILYLNSALNSCHNCVHFSHIITTIFSYILNVFLQIRNEGPANTSYWIPVESTRSFQILNVPDEQNYICVYECNTVNIWCSLSDGTVLAS